MTWLQRAVLACGLLVCPRGADAQTPTLGAVARGSVTDSTGAQIPRAHVHAESVEHVKGINGSNEDQPTVTRTAAADDTGHFALTLPPGTFILTIDAPGFEPYIRENLKLDAGQHIDLSVKLFVAAQSEVVNVPADASASTDPADNKSALTFRGDQLDSFSDDPTLLQQQITSLGGGDPSLPPQVLVDGFSNGQFPPKASIREIRVNQNPYSAQYDQQGSNRIEIFTKPGSSTFHGFVTARGTASAFNSRNPFIQGTQPGYNRERFFGDVSGPLGKKTGFDLNFNGSFDENNSPVNATVLNDSLQPVALSSFIASPSSNQSYTGRLDRQIGANDTATARYSFTRSHTTNGGITQLVLPTEATNASTFVNQFQAGDTHVIGTRVVVESRAQYTRTQTRTDPVSGAPTLVVQGYFSGGGAAGQAVHDHLDNLELQEYISIALKQHFIRTGVRYRLTKDANFSNGGFNGQYIFSPGTVYKTAIAAYQNALADVRNGLTGQQIAARGDGPSQLSVTTGQPSASITTGDVGVYAEDDWKARPDVTFSFGGRLESQSAVPDHLDLAPRVGAAWAPAFRRKTALFTLRTGFGFFYDRFDPGNLLQTIRENGTRELSYIVEAPATFGCQEGTSAGTTCTPTLPSTASLTAVPSSVYRLAPDLREQYLMQGGVTVEKSFGGKGSGSVGWVRGRGVHGFDLRNVNAPLPGTFLVGVPGSGTRPFGGTQDIFQYSSDGIRNNDQLRLNVNLQPTRRLFVWAFYTAGFRTSDVSGAGSQVSNSYDVKQDYGPASGTAGQSFYGGGGGKIGWGFFGNVFLAFNGNQRFNITTGQDLNGDTAYNDRPAFATDLSRPSVVQTAFGNFDTVPIAGQSLVPINYGHRPNTFYSELFVGRNFDFGVPRPDAVKAAAETKTAPGKPKPKPEQPYSFILSVDVSNPLNFVNFAPPVGVLTSPDFGHALALSSQFQSNGSANRTIDFGLAFSF